mgnify:CR=1 FL=1
MKDGLYIAEFRTPLDEAAGVIVIHDGKIMGGDSGMYYRGALTERSGDIEVKMTVRRHNPAAQSVFGDFDAFDLSLKGREKGDHYEFEGRADAAPSLRFAATLKPAQD